MLDNIKNLKILLASNSPRRQELLKEMGVEFEVVAKQGIDESYPPEMNAKNVPEYLAKKKAAAYADMLEKGDSLLITADTVVVCDRKILGKPKNAIDARNMLKMLQGHSHRVLTGVAITTRDKQVSFTVKTKVMMRQLEHDIIDHYVETYKPFDKAGAYGIQEWIGLVGIDYIEGSYHNVMGLPTQRLFSELMNF
ncbi:MAG: Maf family nucleotide pyrophosphatase [Bacteroidales bacterium]|nr:Maf family nucleotide pyrophosphatase [Bacteroidales bacterium]